MVSSELLGDIGELFTDLCAVLCSRYQNSVCESALQRLQFKASYRCTQQLKSALDNLSLTECVSHADDSCSSGQYQDEESYNSHTPNSPFKLWATNLCEKVQQQVIDCESTSASSSLMCNKLYCPQLLTKLVQYYMPTLPLWSHLMLSDVRRHNVQYAMCKNRNIQALAKCCAKDTFPSTTGSQEQRFTVLKHLTLNATKTARLDDFATILYYHFISMEKAYAANYLPLKYRQPSRISVKPVVEHWNKKRPSANLSHNSKVGKYQQACTSTLNRNASSVSRRVFADVPHSTHGRKLPLNAVRNQFCSIPNYNSSCCWINATAQAICCTRAAVDYLDRSSQNLAVDVDNLDNADVRIKHCTFFNLLYHLRCCSPTTVPKEMIANFFDHAGKFIYDNKLTLSMLVGLSI